MHSCIPFTAITKFREVPKKSQLTRLFRPEPNDDTPSLSTGKRKQQRISLLAVESSTTSAFVALVPSCRGNANTVPRPIPCPTASRSCSSRTGRSRRSCCVSAESPRVQRGLHPHHSFSAESLGAVDILGLEHRPAAPLSPTAIITFGNGAGKEVKYKIGRGRGRQWHLRHADLNLSEGSVVFHRPR